MTPHSMHVRGDDDKRLVLQNGGRAYFRVLRLMMNKECSEYGLFCFLGRVKQYVLYIAVYGSGHQFSAVPPVTRLVPGKSIRAKLE